MRIWRTTGTRWAALSALLLTMSLATAPVGMLRVAQAQAGQPGFPAPPQQGSHQQLPGANDKSGEEDSPFSKSIQEKQELARNDDRQKRLVADTDKLLTLATQLHEDVAKTNKNVLSVDVVKRAQEIEKLAHDIKERMKG